MGRTIFFLLLLLHWDQTSNGKLISQEEKHEASERVLIRSKRRWVLTTIDIIEEHPGPFPLKITELFNDKQEDYSLRFNISGQGVTKEPKGALGIDERTGEVFMYKSIDREMYPIFHVAFNVFDAKTGQSLDKTLSFDVAIQDINDNPPVFKPKVLHVQFPENIKEGELPLSLQASDKDEEGNENSRISMTIVSQEPAWPKITLKPIGSVNDSMVTKLIVTGCFDYDKARIYRLLVEAQDHGDPILSSTTTVNIGITDGNTHAPAFTASMLNAQVMEMESNKEILRIPVRDQDTPNTPASRAVFTILKGNEDGNYKIETDPVTNEGVLTVIKAKDYERTTLTELEIGAENEEPLFLCVDWKPVSPVPEALKRNTVKVSVKVIDVNDPPVFRDKIKTVYRIEGEEPGDVLYIPTVTDEDSDPANIRYELVEDPAKWMLIDPKSGKITTARKMDRESPHVHNNTYTAVARAIDDGEPPATGTGTLVVHLGDMNDNAPRITSNTSVMCGNKGDRVRITAEDPDAFPFSGPFTFTLGTDDQELKNLWKLDPSTGAETSLISLTSLPYETYLVPLKVADQQGMAAHSTLRVVVCDCGKGNVCQGFLPRTSSLHGAAIGILLGALLLMALLLCFCFLCTCQKKKNFNRYLQFDGNQTLIAYNDEGGGSVCKADPQLFQSPTSSNCALPTGQQSPTNHFDNMKTGTIQPTQVSNGFRGTVGSRNTYGRSTSWTRNSYNSAYDTIWSGLSRSFSFNMEDLLAMKVSKLSMEQQDVPEYHPYDYSSEGTMISAVSLDKISFCSTGDDLDFLQNLGPKFSTLDEICQQVMKEKQIKL